MNKYRNNIFIFLLCAFLLASNISYAATSWNQTDWSGGMGVSTTDEYAFESSADVSTPGEIIFSEGTEKFTNIGFETDMSSWTTTAGDEIWNFDGTNEYISAADDDAYSFGNGTTDSPFSVSFWVKLDATANLVGFIGKDDNSTLREWGIAQVSGKYRFFLKSGGATTNNNQSIDTTSSVTTGSWVHVVGTYDGRGGNSAADGLSIYLNGVLNTPTGAIKNPYTAMSNKNVPLYIAKYNTAVTPIDGKMTDVILFDKKLSATEVANLYNSGSPRNEMSQALSDNIIAYWRAKNSSNTSGGVLDQSGNGHDATMSNMESSDIIEASDLNFLTFATRDTSVAYNGSTASAKVAATSLPFDLTQSVNVGNTNSYQLVAYAYTDGSAVTSSDAELIVNGSTTPTTYTSMGSGWYKMSATVTGAASSVDYGVQVKANKTVYLDNFSLDASGGTGNTLTSSIFNTGGVATWGTLSYVTSGGGSVLVKVRTSNDSNMFDAPEFSECDTITSGSDISSNDCVTDGEQYVQYQVVMVLGDSGDSPTFEDITLNYIVEDRAAPLPLKLRVASYNTYLGLGTNGSAKNNAIEKHIRRVQPDIITLNEMTDSARTLINSSWRTDLGFGYFASATGGNNPQFNPSILSKYPLSGKRYIVSGPDGDEFTQLFMFNEVDISSITTEKRLGVYSIHATPWCYSAPCRNPAPAYTEFERAVQLKRLTDDIIATKAANPTMEIIVMGDHNDDHGGAQTASFSSNPTGHNWAFVPGSDITFPLLYGTYPDRQYASVNMTITDARRLDGTDYSIIPESNDAFSNPAHIDYIAVSEGIDIDGAEILHSPVDGTGGLKKYNDVLATLDSTTASDHNLTFADFSMPLDFDAPVISAISAGTPGETDTAITWTTDEEATSQVEYGTTSSYGVSSSINSSLVTSHTVNLSGLSSDTTYHYHVISSDAAGNTSTSTDTTFITASIPTPTPTPTPTLTPTPTPTVSLTYSGRSTGRILPIVMNPVLTLRPSAVLTPSLAPSHLPQDEGIPSPDIATEIIPITHLTSDISHGEDSQEVRSLQRYLNTHGYPVALSGPGSLGEETTYFGAATKEALMKFQLGNNISPATGNFGPLTRAFIEMKSQITPSPQSVPVITPTPSSNTDDEVGKPSVIKRFFNWVVDVLNFFN